jgi:N6-L-threonylcarbamoyladenine synthase
VFPVLGVIPMNKAFPTILGVETSCDETAAAVLRGPGEVAASVLASQHDVHARFGGVVPELAARRHIEMIEPVTGEAMRRAGVAWRDLDAVAVTSGPGLAGALLVGLSYGKALAHALDIPLLGINHLEGHAAAAWLEQPDFPTPCVILVASGGHTHLYLAKARGDYRLLGRTLDDAAGEAFDKGAKMLGLGYPGGPAIDRVARAGRGDAIAFPRAHLKRGSLDFSFSGLKTSLLYHLRNLSRAGRAVPVADVAASYQEAIVEVLAAKAFEAVRQEQVSALAVVGGVSANSRLRAVLAARAATQGVQLAVPRTAYCTDNAAMIAAAGAMAYAQGRFAGWNLEADAALALTPGERRSEGEGRGRRSPRNKRRTPFLRSTDTSRA